MYLYFLSAIPCALKLNGEFLGVIGENYSILPYKNGLFEFIPLLRGYAPSCFILRKEQPDNNENARIIDLYGGFLIIPKFSERAASDFKELFFKTIDFPNFSVELRVYVENGIKISVRRGKDKTVKSIPFVPKTLNLEKAFLNERAYLVAFLSDKKTAVFGFEISENGIKTVLKRECDGFEAKNDKVFLTESISDVLRHTVTSTWSFNGGVSLEKIDVYRGKEPYELPEMLLPYAFFEELRLGKNVSDFLTPRLRPRADDLKTFIGDFSAVLPPPHFKNDNDVLLLYGNRAEYANLRYSGRLIDNVTVTTNGK